MILRLSNSRAYGSDGRSQQKILSDPQLSKLFPSKSLSDLILKSCDLYGDLQAIEWHDRSARSDCLREFNLSFRQLSISARNLSTLLKESLRRSDLLATGRKQQHVIGLYMDKNPWLVVILLAVSLTGSAYLNLDVATPTKRNNELVQKAQVSLILTFDASNYPALDFHNFLDLKNLYQNCSSSNSDYLKELSIKSFEVEEDYLCSEDLAYLVSTSGSTGSPKLIPISHSNVLSFLFNYFRRFQRKIPTEAFKNDGSTHTNQTRVFQFPSYAFDVSVMNIWDPLLHGSTICMTSSDNLRSDLMGSIIDLRCDSIDLTPSVASLLLDHPLFTSTSNSTISQVKKLWKSSGLFLNHLNTGSEHLPPSLKQAFITRGVSVCLDYGPSETTVGVISSLNRAIFERDDDHDDDIGKPTGENEIYILEPDGEDLVPLGGIGEICVSGAQVSKGYCDQRLSEGKFIDLDLDCGYKGSRKLRIYRTGDLAQFLPWGSEGFGSIRFLGRKDRQIKISGIRIELDEVENRLNEIISLDSCKKYLIKIIVDHWKTSGDQGSVVSFIQIGQASGLNIGNNTCAADKSDRLEFINSYDQDWFNGLVDEIKRLASLNLPSTMIPKHWILINLIPMNISGKVDRKALKELLIKYFDEKKQNKINLLKKKTLFQTRRERAFYDDEKDLIEVERIEEAVSKAWSECLHGSVDDYNKFEANDDFIRIGGDSIGMMRVIERIRRRGFDRVKFSDLVSCSTFKDFVKVLLKHNRNDSETNGRNQGYDVQQNISEIKTGGIRRTEPYRPFELIESEGDELRKKILDYLRDSYQIEEKEVEDIYPSSSSQDGIITSSQNDPRGMYYAQAIYDLNRDFNSEDLAFGLIELVKRHSNLRTIFIFSGKDLAKFKNGLYSKNKSGILQIVLKNFSSKVNKTCDIVKVERLFDYNSEIEEYLKEDRIKNQFSWGKVCVSMKIFECEESEERKLVWSIHHSLSDGWTLELLMKELKQIIQPSTSKSPLSKIYSSSTGNCSKLNDLQRPSYGEFVKAWGISVDDQNEEILRFWKDYLIDFRSNNKTHKGIKVDHVTQKNLSRTIYRRGELERISRSIGITSAIFFRVAVGIGLYNSGLESSPDVVFGTVRSGRDIELSDGSWAGEISGCCVSVLPTRIRLEGPRMKIVDLLRKEKSEDSDIRKNQLIRLSELNRKFLGDENILDILLTFQSWDLLGEEKKRSDQPIRQPPTRIEMPTRYKLSIEITAEDELKQGKKDFGIEFRVFYDQEVYEDVDIVKFLKEMESVCENLIGCVEKDERLEKIINFKPKRKRVDDEYQLKRHRVEEDREVCLLEGKSINEKVNGYYSDMNENDICCKLSSYKNQQPGIKHYESSEYFSLN
ncbi:hypothetical protein BY996DRAFT_4591567 [Phakopsora pachyrhizi]|nr:hypothetical protein BY996DRAFT_4591567 [Phakopsora pachyrhizi]